MAAADEDRTFVLTAPAARWAIATLRAAKVHPFFLAYLHLRKRAADEGNPVIAPHWDELGELLRVPGGPPGKPYYRPFWNGTVDDPGRYWLNRNIAGSYAPSSLRNVPTRVIETVGSEFSLKPSHAALARQHLLYDQPLPAIAVAAFFYRNYGFHSPPPHTPSPFDLVLILRDDFQLEDDAEFSQLFHDGLEIDPGQVEPWFELLDEDLETE